MEEKDGFQRWGWAPWRSMDIPQTRLPQGLIWAPQKAAPCHLPPIQRVVHTYVPGTDHQYCEGVLPVGNMSLGGGYLPVFVSGPPRQQCISGDQQALWLLYMHWVGELPWSPVVQAQE